MRFQQYPAFQFVRRSRLEKGVGEVSTLHLDVLLGWVGDALATESNLLSYMPIAGDCCWLRDAPRPPSPPREGETLRLDF